MIGPNKITCIVLQLTIEQSILHYPPSILWLSRLCCEVATPSRANLLVTQTELKWTCRVKASRHWTTQSASEIRTKQEWTIVCAKRRCTASLDVMTSTLKSCASKLEGTHEKDIIQIELINRSLVTYSFGSRYEPTTGRNRIIIH